MRITIAISALAFNLAT
jgi:hypothetical protein